MHVRIGSLAALAAALCAFCTNILAAPATYDFEGIVTSKINRGGQSLPEFIAPGTRFSGVVTIDVTAPPSNSVLDLRVRFESGDLLLSDPADSGFLSLIDSQALEAPPPFYELASIVRRTAPLPGIENGVSMVINWTGEPGAPRQFPPQGEDLDLTTLIPKQGWTMTWGTTSASDAAGTIATLRRRGSGLDEYHEDFADGAAQGWVAQSGQWAVESGAYRNFTNTAFTASIQPGVSLPDEFVTLTDISLSWGATGNTAGVVFNYGGGANFYEVRINAQGTATLNKVIRGVRRTVASGTYFGAGVRRWVTVYVKRGKPRTQIEINGKRVFDIALSELTGGSAGVFSSWNMARFDNVLIGAPIPTAELRFLSFDTASLEGLAPLSGTWTVTNGALRSSSNQAASIALFQPLTVGNVYEIAASIHSEWNAPGNMSGFVYDYVDARNYREARIRLASDRVATLLLIEVVDGVRREVARTNAELAGADFRKVRLALTREDDLVVFGVHVKARLYVKQAPRPGATRLGLLTSWNLARFDDVTLYRVTTQ